MNAMFGEIVRKLQNTVYYSLSSNSGTVLLT